MDEQNISSKCCFQCNNENNLIFIGLLPYCKSCYNIELETFLSYQKNRTTFYPEIDHIFDHVYLGNEDGSREKEKLKEFGITHVLVCGSFLEKRHPDDFVYKCLELDDSMEENIYRYFSEAIKFIDSAGKVYVHCHAGISRSASIVTAYIMWKRKINFEDAFEFLKSKRRQVQPNPNFREQLKKFEQDI